MAGENRVEDDAVDDDAGAVTVERRGPRVARGAGGPADEDGFPLQRCAHLRGLLLEARHIRAVAGDGPSKRIQSPEKKPVIRSQLVWWRIESGGCKRRGLGDDRFQSRVARFNSVETWRGFEKRLGRIDARFRQRADRAVRGGVVPGDGPGRIRDSNKKGTVPLDFGGTVPFLLVPLTTGGSWMSRSKLS